MTNSIPTISISGKFLWQLFLLADEIANHPDVCQNEDIQYLATDLAVGLSELVKEFEIMQKEKFEELPYDDSIFSNPDFSWYVED